MQQVIYLQNLNDSGSGSLRDAAQTGGDRTIIVPKELNGTIQLEYHWAAPPAIPGYLHITNDNIATIANSDVRLANYGIYNKADNVVISGLRVYGIEEPNPTKARFPLYTDGNNVVIDRCNFIGCDNQHISIWEDADNVTIQNSILAYPIPEKKYTDRESRLNCLIQKANNITFYNCLFVGGSNRNPRFGSNDSVPRSLRLINCVFFNCGRMLDIVTGDTSVLDITLVNNRFVKGEMPDAFPLATTGYPVGETFPVMQEPLNNAAITIRESGNVINGYAEFMRPGMNVTVAAPDPITDFVVKDANEIDVRDIGLFDEISEIVYHDVENMTSRFIASIAELPTL